MHLLTTLPATASEPPLADDSDLLLAVAHEKRVAILRELCRRELCVCELQDVFGWSQPLISHHLAILRKAGLVEDRRDAQWVYYSISPRRLADLRQLLGFLFEPGELPTAARCGSNQRCCPSE
jgi:ArsR family transcriptional regulator, arsenate/arsenite/antimonite-responsive transcriptional repressor